jgi:hypothetical protein
MAHTSPTQHTAHTARTSHGIQRTQRTAARAPGNKGRIRYGMATIKAHPGREMACGPEPAGASEHRS